jgi:hypothetical protein
MGRGIFFFFLSHSTPNDERGSTTTHQPHMDTYRGANELISQHPQ